MTYSTPELQRIGAAQNLVLGMGPDHKLPTAENCEVVGAEEYNVQGTNPDESEW